MFKMFLFNVHYVMTPELLSQPSRILKTQKSRDENFTLSLQHRLYDTHRLVRHKNINLQF